MSERLYKLQQAMLSVGLNEYPQSLINGELTDGRGADISLIDPFTEEVLFTYADADRFS